MSEDLDAHGLADPLEAIRLDSVLVDLATIFLPAEGAAGRGRLLTGRLRTPG
jgi:hypothetical protein